MGYMYQPLMLLYQQLQTSIADSIITVLYNGELYSHDNC
jgi:hypothetical protein